MRHNILNIHTLTIVNTNNFVITTHLQIIDINQQHIREFKYDRT